MNTRPINEAVLSRLHLPAGLDLGEIRLERWANLDREQVRVTAEAVGWGPSLHTTLMDWEATSSSERADDIATALLPHAALQRQRAEAAIALGFGRIRPRNAALLTHVVADRALMELRPQAAWFAEGAIRKLETVAIDGLRTSYRRDNITVSDGTEDDPRPRILLTTTTMWGNYDGSVLNIMARLPDTAVSAMVGRRVRDVLDPQGLDPAMLRVLDREIIHAESKGATTRLVTDPEWMPLAVATKPAVTSLWLGTGGRA